MRGFITQACIDEILARTDIVSLVGEYAQLQQRGADWWCCCPFHNERTPSFSVSPSKGFYYCFGCHASGNAVSFLMEMEKLSYPEALEALARKSGVELVYEEGTLRKEARTDSRKDDYIDLYNRVVTSFHYMLMQTEAGRPALEYISRRGISKASLEKFRLGYAPGDRFWLKGFLRRKGYSDEFLRESGLFSQRNADAAFFFNRLMFPIFDRRGQAVALGGRLLDGDGPKYLNSGDLIQYRKGETLYAFNLAKQAIREAKAVVFCEGYMDVIAYHQCGVCNAVAPLGTALTEEQLKLVKGFAETALLSFDSDDAGRTATRRAILMCRRQNLTVRIIRLEGGKDPAEIMLKFGPESLTAAVKNAILDSDFLLSALMHEYPNDSPENKAKASLAFFPYVDALQSDIQKSASLEQLCQAYGLSPEAVQRDFGNRAQARSRLAQKSSSVPDAQPRLRMTAELRAVMAVLADTNQFALMQEELAEDDFEDSVAKYVFSLMRQCAAKNALSVAAVLDLCADGALRGKIAEVLASGEFSQNTEQAVRDSVGLIRRNSLERQRRELLDRIQHFTVVTPQDAELMQRLLAQKMSVDAALKR